MIDVGLKASRLNVINTFLVFMEIIYNWETSNDYRTHRSTFLEQNYADHRRISYLIILYCEYMRIPT